MSVTNFAAHKANIGETEYEPFELDADDVLEGPFNGEVHWLRQESAGSGVLLAGLFRCAKSVVNYEFSGDETFHVLSGSATFALIGGESTTVSEGDIASFPKGAKALVTHHSPFKKFFVISG